MTYLETLKQHHSFQDLVESKAKIFDFRDAQFLIDLYKWFKIYSQENLRIFKTLSPQTTLSNNEKELLEQKIADAAFAFNYLKTFGSIFLDRILYSNKAIEQLKGLFEKNTEFNYVKTINSKGQSVYIFKNKEYPTKFIDELLKEQTKLDKDQCEILAVLLVGSKEIVSMLVLNHLNRQ